VGTVTIDWNSDGTATINGESCVAVCYIWDAGNVGQWIPCVANGLPIPWSEGATCVMQFGCSGGSVLQAGIVRNAQGYTVTGAELMVGGAKCSFN
jgi:hypothetical protein